MDASLDAHRFRALAEEQAALRRVATLVARGATQQEFFSAVTEEIGKLLPVDFATMGRFEKGDTLYAIETPGGYLLTPYDPAFEKKMAKAEEIIGRYRNTLRALAK